MNSNNTRIKLNSIKSKKLNPGQGGSLPVRVMIPKNTFFRIIPDSNIETAVAYHNNHWYLFHSDISNHYAGKLKKLSNATLYQGITDKGEEFILPVVEPWPGYADSWYNSLQNIAQQAQDKYIKIEKNNNQDCYDIIDSKRIIGNTNTQSTLEHVIDKAFPDPYYVDYDAHTLLDELYID